MSNWEKPKTAEQYVESITNNPENEINITKKFYHDPFFYDLVPNLSGKKVLDVGCGDGYMLQTLGEWFKDAVLYGTDLPEMIQQAKKNKMPSNVHMVGASCYELPFVCNSMDLVLSSLLAHWIDDFEKMVSEMYRVLRPGGELVISLIHPHTFKVGKWEGLETDNPKYIIDQDVTQPHNYDVFINKTVGPVIYYMRPLDYFPFIVSKLGFSGFRMLQPTVQDEELLRVRPELRKYKKHPLYLFIDAKK